jgi:hypothetical protein
MTNHEAAGTHEAAPAWLLEQARQLLRRPHDPTAGLWPRASALLGRQALEARLEALCEAEHRGLGRCGSTRAQLLCLWESVDERLAREATHTWGALTQACHYHAYDLPPTAEELESWLASVERLVTGELDDV